MRKDDSSEGKKLEALKQWRKLYIESLIDHLRPSGSVLEVGFGLGHAAERIQSHHPKAHTIIESDPKIAKEAKQWAAKHSHVTVIQDFWQNAMVGLGQFDAIFFNDFPLDSDIEFLKSVSSEDIASTSSKAKKLVEALEKQMAQITVKFSDQDIEDFYQKVGQFNLQELPSFLSTLKKKGCITDKQYKTAMKKYHLENDHSQKTAIDPSKLVNPMLDFMETCLDNHMKKGSRLSSFLITSISKYEDASFFDRIILNPKVDYQEQLISIPIPNFHPIDSLIMLIEKS